MDSRLANVLLIIGSLIVVTYEIVHDSDEDSFERNTNPRQICINLKNYSQRFAMEEFVESLSIQWNHFYPDEGSNVSGSRNTLESRLHDLLQTCRFEPEKNVKVMRFNADKEPEPAGVVDILTKELMHGNLVIKVGYKKPPCALLRQLLHCMEADGFQRMYPNERLIVLALKFSTEVESIIDEWIALLYQHGDIVDVQNSTKCLHAKGFSDLKYNEKPIIEYVH